MPARLALPPQRSAAALAARSADGLESDAEGRVRATNHEHDAVLRRAPAGEWEMAAHDPRLLWPDTMAVAADGRLHVTANRLRRQAKYQRGEDLRRKPRTLFRIRLGVRPVPPR